MSAKRAIHFLRSLPLFPFIPLVPIGLLVGSFVLSVFALREARLAHRALAPA